MTKAEIEREAYRILLLALVGFWHECRRTPLEAVALSELERRCDEYAAACAAVDAEKARAQVRA